MNAPGHPLRGMRGMTLIEILTVMTVLVIVTTVAAPGMRSFGLSQRAKALSFDLVSDLLNARSEALKRNTAVTVSPIDTHWTNGWTASTAAQRLTTRQQDASSLRLTGAPDAIVFNVFGRVASPAGSVRISVLTADSGVDAAARCIELDPSGYARVKLGACP